jgi:hypothetical protein
LGRNGFVNAADGCVLTCEHDDRPRAPIDDGCALVTMDVSTQAENPPVLQRMRAHLE